MNTTITYVSADEVERAEAFRHGDDQVCQHPCEVGRLDGGTVLIIDFNAILFDDTDAAINLVRNAIKQGTRVGIHTYSPGVAVHILQSHPNVVVAKTQRRVRAALRRPLTPQPVAAAAEPSFRSPHHEGVSDDQNRSRPRTGETEPGPAGPADLPGRASRPVPTLAGTGRRSGTNDP